MNSKTVLSEGLVKRSRWAGYVCILGVSVGLVSCGQALENALAPDPQTETWTGGPSRPPVEPPQDVSSPKVADEHNDAQVQQTTPSTFADITEAPENLQPYVDDLARLEILNPRGETADGEPLFSPNQPIKRSTFVRWLFQARNRYNRDRPTQQFRLASKDSSEPVYQDVPTSHPDFPYIQGLAEAGYLPSPLTGDTAEIAFKPDANLTRETLIRWKVPIDQQKLLSTVTTAKVAETWGFKDAEKINPNAASAVVADHDNKELSNIRRLVGASLLLQPQKAVTRAEAAAVLWFFGVDGQGVSAKDIIRAEAQAINSEPDETPSSSESSADQPAIGEADPTDAPNPEASPTEN